MELPLLLFLLLTSAAAAATPPSSSAPSPASSTAISPAPKSSPSSSSSTLDPKQLRALQSLGIPTTKDPCSTLHCDSSKPFRHLLSLRLSNCSDDLSLSTTALKSLSTLQSLQFSDCPISPIRFPPELTSSLLSFSCIHSLRRLTGVFLSRLHNLTDLTVSDVPISASGPSIILSNLKNLQSLTISNTNLSGHLPKSWHHNLSHIDLSANQLKGKIHPSITSLETLKSLNLSSNQLSGEIPSSIGDLMDLKNLSLASNSLSGSIPESLSATDLVHLDLSSNQFNGSIPGFIADFTGLKYLNLEGNNFQGIMPFNGSFVKKLVVFKIGENSNLCYNKTTISSKVKLGISPCDKNGLPMSPPAESGSGGGDDSDYSDDDDSENSTSEKSKGHSGPNKVVLGIAIALASIIFLIIFLILLSKWCA